ncbi:MAG: thiolase family protein [Desulfomonilia bacterium]|jgi:acetyl-CoA acyltransferase|uniref:Acetyl-CoA C-acyltransferase n=1 Tax=anaerobic digester metagenome TaxID=1263854 RepID=A0A485LUI8_9ZZZZ
MREAYIVTSVRTPGCRRGKGAFAFTRPEDLLKSALNGLMERTPGVEKKDVEDILVGCAFPEAEQGLNIGRVIAQIAEFPDSTCGATVNRFCASGLEAIALQAMRIMAGYCDVAIGAGLESMSIVPMGGNLPRPHPEQALKSPEVYMSMGMTAENVANRYKITREMQDEWGFHSQAKAAQAQKAGKFKEIVPTEAVRFVEKDGITVKETFIQDFDDGVRPTTIEGLAKLRPAFAAMGSVTAGNSSQTTDGAACSLIMSGEAVKKFGVKPLAKLVVYTTAGCRADEMGVGPAYAIPKALKMAGLKVEDIDLWEVNEAFASQCIYSLQQLGLYEKKELWVSDSDKRIINVNGGAIALGHPLGCTGAKLCAQLMTEMRERGAKFGVESMCIGGGMGAAAVFELCD